MAHKNVDGKEEPKGSKHKMHHEHVMEHHAAGDHIHNVDHVEKFYGGDGHEHEQHKVKKMKHGGSC